MTLMYSSGLDAGGSRFFGDFDLNKEFPGKPAYESLEEMGESFLIQMNCDYYPDLFQKNQNCPCHTSLTIDHMFWVLCLVDIRTLLQRCVIW